MRVLVAEDHERLARAVAAGLRRYGMIVDVALDGDDALARLGANRYDVVILDRDLPGTHGDDICRTLVAERCESRVLMLTAASSVKDRVEGLGLGADDYLPKPFDFAEMVARVQALGRRPGAPKPEHLGYRDLTVDPQKRLADRRPAPGTQPERVRGTGMPARRRGKAGASGGTARTSVGRGDRPVHHDRQSHDQPAARQARRPAHDRDRPRTRLPDRRPVMRLPHRTARLRLTRLYGALFLLFGGVLVAITYLLFEGATAFRAPTIPKVPNPAPIENIKLPTPLAETLPWELFQAQQQLAQAQNQLTTLPASPAAGAVSSRSPFTGPISAQDQQLTRAEHQLTQDQHQLAQTVHQLSESVRQLTQAGAAQAT